MQTSEQIMSKQTEFWNKLTNETELVLRLELEVSKQPNFKITINNDVVYDQTATEIIEITYPYQQQKDIEINMWMDGKTDNDTVVDENGNILSDKYIKINRLIVNNFSLEKNYNFYYNNLNYYNQNNESINVEQGFWFNDHKLNLSFTQPFITWYIDHVGQPTHTSYRRSLSSDTLFQKLVNSLDLLD